MTMDSLGLMFLVDVCIDWNSLLGAFFKSLVLVDTLNILEL